MLRDAIALKQLTTHLFSKYLSVKCCSRGCEYSNKQKRNTSMSQGPYILVGEEEVDIKQNLKS